MPNRVTRATFLNKEYTSSLRPEISAVRYRPFFFVCPEFNFP